MAVYYFDVRENDSLEADGLGLDLKSADLVKKEAISVLFGLLRDAIQTKDRHEIAVEVRNIRGSVVLKTMLAFSAETEPSASS